MGIDNTTRRMQEDPAERLLLLAEGMVTGDAETFITGQERTGQAQFVASELLPSKYHGTRTAWEALGFRFGEPVDGDPLFMHATLPEGWEKRATDHAMGSVIVDKLGRERASVFYKAAFYDRSAHMNLVSVSWYVTKHVEYGGPLVISDEWATRDAVLEAMRALADGAREEAAEFRGFSGDDSSGRRDEANRSRCAEIAAGKEATAAKYDAVIARLEAEVPASG